jgi:hypothetical protein
MGWQAMPSRLRIGSRCGFSAGFGANLTITTRLGKKNLHIE